MRPCWIRVGPKPNDFIRGRRRFEHRHTQGEEGHVKTEAETGRMCLQAKDCWQPPVSGEARKDSSLEPSVGARPWFQTPGLQNWRRVNVCCFKPPSLWLCHGSPGKGTQNIYHDSEQYLGPLPSQSCPTPAKFSSVV